jgi:hypothetical protein
MKVAQGAQSRENELRHDRQSYLARFFALAGTATVVTVQGI